MIDRQIGVYRMVSLLGAGGMGEVYRARDTKLQRDVAIKVLPAFLANDAERIARLALEARTLASLNHPHIATIHGYEDADGVCALVMELVEGPTLANRLASSQPFSLAEVLDIGSQIAEALEAAHDRGIIHRDLKPANLKLARDGHIKVLDFGLATAFVKPGEGAGAGLTQAPTVAAADGHSGAIVGTPAYMSPEQARGQTVDKRTDVWAFGCVVYEMLTGRPAFAGATIADTLAAVLERAPDWSALPPNTPGAVRQLLRRCLQKDDSRRLRDIGDARLELDEARANPVGDEAGSRSHRDARPITAVAVALTGLALAAAGFGFWLFRAEATPAEIRLEINTPQTRDPSLAISPDGRMVVFVAKDRGPSSLWLRSLDSTIARPLTGTEGASSPFWSPDGRSIGFFADAALKRMDIDNGSIRILATVSPASAGGTWGRDGTIVYSLSPGRPLLQVSATGGEPTPVTRFDAAQQSGHVSPRFLPDGRHFLFFVNGRPESRGVYVGRLDDPDATRLFNAETPAVFAATGHLLFVRDGRLLAQRFNLERLEPQGDAVPIAEGVSAATYLAASAAGPIAYRTLSADSGQRRLVWFDRAGHETAEAVYPDTSGLGPALSRDGRRVALNRFQDGNMDIWWYDVDRRTWNRVTVDPGDDIFPLWSPDGTRLAFGSNRVDGQVTDAHTQNLFWTRVDAQESATELLLATPAIKFLTDWSPDGRTLLFDSTGSTGGTDIWALPLDTREPFAVVHTEFNERLAQFAPDGRWIAYQSDKTGRFEIYVRPFPGQGGDLLVSTNGGAQPRWNPDGTELFYVGADDQLMTVPIRRSPEDGSVEPGSPVALFATDVGTGAPSTVRQQYMVAPDGRSFVMNSVPQESGASPITVILNWKPPPAR